MYICRHPSCLINPCTNSKKKTFSTTVNTHILYNGNSGIESAVYNPSKAHTVLVKCVMICLVCLSYSYSQPDSVYLYGIRNTIFLSRKLKHM